MSWDDDARADTQRIESATELAEVIRLRKLRTAIRETAQRRREAGSCEPRSLGG